eukprot:TRINITY_DN6320_c0_g1_i4.p1 TRINITY_DN6320_c0_g1~~TRINITY_DN6320_c0_g1_i4.p1  ORF type:complete len:427 (-),score=66.25 TRINITY_DN6320_c0_g1_i4:209-1456(-)
MEPRRKGDVNDGPVLPKLPTPSPVTGLVDPEEAQVYLQEYEKAHVRMADRVNQLERTREYLMGMRQNLVSKIGQLETDLDRAVAASPARSLLEKVQAKVSNPYPQSASPAQSTQNFGVPAHLQPQAQRQPTPPAPVPASTPAPVQQQAQRLAPTAPPQQPQAQRAAPAAQAQPQQQRVTPMQPVPPQSQRPISAAPVHPPPSQVTQQFYPHAVAQTRARPVIRNPPEILKLNAPDAAACQGTYKLVQDFTFNSYPVWKQLLGAHYLFSCIDGVLLIRDSIPTTGPQEDYLGGAIATIYAHEGSMPQDIRHWQVDDQDGWRDDPRIVFTVAAGSAGQGQETTDIDSGDVAAEADVDDDENDDDYGEEGGESEEDSDDSSDSVILNELPQRSITLYNLPNPSTFLKPKERRTMTAQF